MESFAQHLTKMRQTALEDTLASSKNVKDFLLRSLNTRGYCSVSCEYLGGYTDKQIENMLKSEGIVIYNVIRVKINYPYGHKKFLKLRAEYQKQYESSTECLEFDWYFGYNLKPDTYINILVEKIKKGCEESARKRKTEYSLCFDTSPIEYVRTKLSEKMYELGIGFGWDEDQVVFEVDW